MTNNNMKKNATKFYCDICDFKCSKQSNWNTHLNTLKHKILINPNKKMPKNAKNFHCENCDFKCIYQSNWDKHLLNHNHKILINSEKMPKNATSKYECPCGKFYKHASSLCAHKKKCLIKEENIITCLLYTSPSPRDLSTSRMPSSA